MGRLDDLRDEIASIEEQIASIEARAANMTGRSAHNLLMWADAATATLSALRDELFCIESRIATRAHAMGHSGSEY